MINKRRKIVKNNTTETKFSKGELETILAECRVPGANINAIANKYGIPYTTLRSKLEAQKPDDIMEQGVSFKKMVNKAYRLQFKLLNEILNDVEHKELSFKEKISAFKEVNTFTQKHIMNDNKEDNIDGEYTLEEVKKNKSKQIKDLPDTQENREGMLSLILGGK